MGCVVQRFALWSLIFVLLDLSPLPGQIVFNGEPVREDGETRINAAEWFFRQRAFPGNSIPRSYRFAALEQLERSGRRFAPQLAPSADVTGRWIELGPDNVGGRTLALAIHPNNDDILYAGLADGGVFKTTDGGLTWIALNDKLPSLAVKSIVLDPTNPEIVYAGTGEGYFNIDAAIGQGVMKSTDGGVTWVHGPPFAQYVNRLAINPSAPRTLYAATRTGIFKTSDGNDTWTLVFPNHNCIDLSLDPDNPQVLLTAVWDRAANQTGNGIWRTTDGGATWARVSGGLPEGRLIGRVALARAPSNSRVVYAGVAQLNSSAPVMGIWKSTDGGATWVQFPGTPSYCGSQCWYDSELSVHPFDPEVVFAGGLFLWKSSKGGETWSRSDSGVHVDHHSMAFGKRNRDLVYSGNDGGVFRSIDGGTTWSAMNYGLGGTQFYALAISATDPTITYGGTQDNGTQKGSGAAGFQQVLGGDGMVPLVDPTDPNFVYAESQNGGLARSTNGGISFLGARFGLTASDRFNWVTPWIIDPSNPQVLYVGSHRLYKSTNRAVAWMVLSGDLTRGSGTVSAIAVAPSDSNVLYAGTSDGLVWTATDGGATTESFRRITPGLPNRYVTRLRVHPRDARIVYATFSGFNNAGGMSGHVFKSTDGGESWRDISSNLPDLPVQVIVIDPRVPSTLFLGTDLGCFRSLDDGGAWEPFNDGLPNVVVDDMAYFGNTNLLRIATHGRGIWQYTAPGRAASKVVSIVGNNQKAASGGDLAFPVRVAVLDAEGVPVPNVPVMFEAPGTSPTGTFSDGSSRVEVQTDLYGVANLPRFRLDGGDGSFTIMASASGAMTPAMISITSVATAAQLTRIQPDSAVAGQVIIGGQNVSLRGSGFAMPYTVYFVQNGTWYAQTTNTFRVSSNEIYASIPSGLALGKATVVVNSAGELTPGIELDITRVSTATPVFSLVPSAPSPGQQFSADLVGQQPLQERFTLTQGSSRYSASSDLSAVKFALFTLPGYPFQPGAATLEFKNHNSSQTSSFAFTIPDRPTAADLLNPGLGAPEQLLTLLTTGLRGGFASVAQLNVVSFTQGNTTVEAPGLGFSNGALLVQIPSSLSAGTTTTLRVRSTFANGTATSNPVTFLISAPMPTASPTLSPISVAPGARVTASTGTIGAFNTSMRRNRVTIRAGGIDYPAAVTSVNSLGTVLGFTVPQGLPEGAGTVQIVTDFGSTSVTRLQSGNLTIVRPRELTIVSGDLQTADAGQPFAVPIAVKLTEADGTPIPNVTVTFSAPASGTSGFFENGGSTTNSALTNSSGVATASIFKAARSGGAYVLRATIAGHPGEAVFRLRNRNLGDRRELSLAAHGALSSETSGADSGIRSGYVTASAASAPVAGISIFGLRDADGNLTSEAGVAEAMPSSSQLVFVDGRLSTYTGIALVNDNASGTSVTLRLRNLAGNQVGDAVSIFLEPRAQTARFFSQIFRDMPQPFVGTASSTSQLPVAAVTLRAVINDRGETIYSALPVAIAPASPATGGQLAFPHLAAGEGYRASIVLLNPTASTMTGKLSFFDSMGNPSGFGSAAPVVSYSIAPNGYFLLEATAAANAPLWTGYAVASADAGSPTPFGSILFGSTIGTTVVAEAGVPGSKSLSRALLYVDTVSMRSQSGSETTYYTGVAFVNRGSATAKVRLLLRGEKAEVLGIPVTIELEPGRQTARFVDELLGSVATGIRGSLEIASDRPVEMVTLRGAVGVRGEFLFTTLPVADYGASLSKLLFAHFADGAGYTTHTVVLNPSEKSAGATVSYFGPGGAAATVDLRK